MELPKKIKDELKNELKEYVESSNLVNMRECGEGIYVLKYKKKVFYDNLWNEYIAEYTLMDEQSRLEWVRNYMEAV